MSDPELHDEDSDDTCQRCGGDGVVFECFDGFCEDADVGCDDCTRNCPVCTEGRVRAARGSPVAKPPSNAEEIVEKPRPTPTQGDGG